MPFYFRKSVKAGPFRFNLSSGGVGVSVGVKGFRVGTGPRGHYVYAGRNGFYYRASFSGALRDSLPSSSQSLLLDSIRPVPDDMIVITSGDICAMRDAAFADFLHEINTKNQQVRMATLFGSIAVAFSLVCLIIVGPGAFAALTMAPIAWIAGRWLDSYRRVAVLFYEMDDAGQSGYKRLCAALDTLAACHGKWHIEAGKAVRDLTTWKREAGASHLVARHPLAIGYQLPALLRCNITPPAFSVRGRTFHFLPDVILVQDSSGFGAVGYNALRISHHLSNFIETGAVPRDAQISHHTWQHPNKSGGPDRRFKSNRQLPVCRYETMHLSSPSGINELVEFSRTGLVQEFVRAVASVPRNAGLDQGRLLPSADDMSQGALRGENSPAVSDFKIASIAAAIMAFIAALTIYALPHRSFQEPEKPKAPIADIIPADEMAFVLPRKLNCRSDANASSVSVRRYDRRARVHVIGRRSDWVQIGDPDGNCWVNARYLKTAAKSDITSVQPPRPHQAAAAKNAGPLEVQAEPNLAPTPEVVTDQPVKVVDQTQDAFMGDPKAAEAIEVATRRALESGHVEMWRASRSRRGYVVPSEAETYGSQTCRNAFATLIDGNRQDQSNPVRWCKINGESEWDSEH